MIPAGGLRPRLAVDDDAMTRAHLAYHPPPRRQPRARRERGGERMILAAGQHPPQCLKVRGVLLGRRAGGAGAGNPVRSVRRNVTAGLLYRACRGDQPVTWAQRARQQVDAHAARGRYVPQVGQQAVAPRPAASGPAS